jgi:hypothetical protein
MRVLTVYTYPWNNRNNIFLMRYVLSAPRGKNGATQLKGRKRRRSVGGADPRLIARKRAQSSLAQTLKTNHAAELFRNNMRVHGHTYKGKPLGKPQALSQKSFA